eukprot:474060_1
MLIISTTAINNVMNINDKLRIIVDILNKKEYNIDIITTYKWHEINGLLTDNDIINYMETTSNSFNLVLMSNVLKQGVKYSFQLEIFKNKISDGIIIASGNSSITTIFVTNPPEIIANSLRMFPNCSDGVIYFDSMDEYLKDTHKWFLSINAHGYHLPLLYQFGYKVNSDNNSYNYLHSNLLSTSYISDIILPVGNIELIATVFDSIGSMVSDSIKCNIQLNSYSKCIDLQQFEDKLILFVTNHEKYSYILQESLSYLEYVSNYHNAIENSDKCVEYVLVTIIEILFTEIDDLCIEERNSVILLSQVLTLWIETANYFFLNNNRFDYN